MTTRWPLERVSSQGTDCDIGQPIFGVVKLSENSGRYQRKIVQCRRALDVGDDGAGLFVAAENDSFDLGCDWFELLTAHGLDSSAEATFYTLSRDGALQCIFPLSVQQRRVVSLSTFYSSLYRPLLAATAEPEDIGAMTHRVVTDYRCSSIRLNAMDPLHPSFNITIEGLRSAGLAPFTFFDFGNWYMPVKGDYNAYFEGLSSRMKNTIKRRTARFEKSLQGRIEILCGIEDVPRAIAVWEQVYRSSWKVAEPFPRFIPALIRLCAQRGWLRFGLVSYKGVPIAAQIWIVNNARAAIYKLAYDENYATYSAGTILSARLMRFVIDTDGVREVDYLVGDDAYKKDWMSHRRERMGIIAFNRRSLQGLAGSIGQTLGGLRKRLA